MDPVKIAVVTGGNKGIGYAIVKGLCEKFHGIVYLTARDVQRGQAAVKEIEKLGLPNKLRFHQLDVEDETSVERFRDYIRDTHGGIDLLVNNAGIAFKQDATDPFEVQAQKTVQVNFFGLQRVSQMFFPLLRPRSRVVNLSSCCGHLSKIPGDKLRSRFNCPDLTEEDLSDLMNEFIKSAKKGTNVEDGWGSSAYNVSKVGVSKLTFIQQKQLDHDPLKYGINVNCVHPGYVDTDMSSHKGPLTVEQGADAPLYLALLPPDSSIKGCYVWRDRTLINWAADTTPTPY